MAKRQAAFRWLLKSERTKKWKKRRSRPSIPRVSFMRFPKKQEILLRTGFRSIFTKITSAFYPWFESHVDRWQGEWNRLHGIKKDSWEAEVILFLKSIDEDLESFIVGTATGISAERYVNQVAEAMLVFAQNDLARQLKKFVGESFYGGTEWWSVVKKEWLSVLRRKARGSASDFMESIRQAVYKGVQQDLPFNEIVQNIRKLGPQLTKGRAAFLARDLVGTLHSQITKNLHLVIGVHIYTWLTQSDERVRGRPGGLYPNAIPTHWMMEGVICDWNDPTVYSKDLGKTWIPRLEVMPKEHPGEPFACRGIGLPMMDALVDEIDTEIQEGEL